MISNKLLRAGVFCSVLALLGSVAGCGGGGSSGGNGGTPNTTAKQTVLVYIIGSDLESAGQNATKDLAEMMKAGSNDNLNVVVTTGGANSNGFKTVKRHLVQKGSLQTLTDLGSVNMGNAQTLQDFVTWGVQTYPADKYTLVLWNHGAGPVSSDDDIAVLGPDEIHKDGLSLAEIDSALSNSRVATGKSFETIGFDACLMGSMEVASMLTKHANYMVASEELEPGTGWEYGTWLNAIQANPAITGNALGKVIADSYLTAQQADKSNGVTLSVTDLSKVPALVSAFTDFASKAQANFSNDALTTRITLASARNKSLSYGADYALQSFFDLVDVKHLMQNAATAYPTESANVISKLDAAILHKVASTDMAARSNGLSVYMPHREIDSSSAEAQSALKKKMDNYKTVSPTTWSTLLDGYVQNAYQDTTAPTIPTPSRSGNTVTATVTDADLSDVFVVTGQFVDKTMSIYSLETMDNKGSGNFSYELNTNAVTLNGHPVSTYITDINPDQDIKYIEIPITYDGKSASIRYTTSPSTTEISAELFVDEEGNGASRSSEFKVGATIQPLARSMNVDTDEEVLAPMGSSFVLESDSPTIANGSLPQGNYVSMIMASDFSGNLGFGGHYIVTAP